MARRKKAPTKLIRVDAGFAQAMEELAKRNDIEVTEASRRLKGKMKGFKVRVEDVPF